MVGLPELMLSVAPSAGSGLDSAASLSALPGPPDLPELTLADVAVEDAVNLRPGTLWKIPWELLVLGPFANCMLTDGTEVRHITASAMVRSAVRRSTGPVEPLHPEDYALLPVLAPAMTLFAAAQLLVDVGWEFAVVGGAENRLVTPQSVFRAILRRAKMEPSTGAGCGAQLGRHPVGLLDSSSLPESATRAKLSGRRGGNP